MYENEYLDLMCAIKPVERFFTSELYIETCIF